MPKTLTPGQLEAIERNALFNAAAHSGTAEVGAVVGKSLGESPEIRGMAGEVAKAAAEAVRRVNSLSLGEQQALLEAKYPEALAASNAKRAQQKAEDKAQATQFPPLPHATKGKVVLRLPPEPSGYMTIGHAMAGVINSAYRDMYQGELWLRFEDTNPRKVRKDYYDSFRDGYRWVGIRWDHEKNVSSDMEVLYFHARRLVEMGEAYACACPADLVKKLRAEGKPCEHRTHPVEANLKVWEGMLARRYKEGEWVIRLKGDMQGLDASLRDPNILRVIQAAHPVVGTKYVVWPVYDFEVVVEDKLCEVTHILRSSEFHVSLQERIRELLRFPPVVVEQFSRFNFKGTPVSKRLLRPLVEEKVVSGWDDPRMPTIEGVKRRGILPEAIRQFTLQVGYGKTEHTFDWTLLFAVNRKILDPISLRVYFVPDPVQLRVKGGPQKDLSLQFHPTFEGLGRRAVSVPEGPRLLVPGADVDAMRPGEVFRLMDLYNVRLTKKGDSSQAEFVGDERLPDVRKVQWVLDDSEKRDVSVLEPAELFLEDETPNPHSLRVRKGCAEAAFSNLAVGDIVQFPRYGFVRVDAPGRCVLAHP
ncbi:MAG: glutamate--tRNA ligase [Nitrososphaerota archaeon]|nr:glutamate--tRNA ligase [Nitrososphaerota archaeon]MDG6966679.1 glutamate--tRNA ligase [Nitrososphaerota archaeon]MDG6979258.1 glutamate--tRNA ligase [Nitrososphaerota archaeon]MDG7021479.1 glutamate--tRNA ligase [Nitrososphaerota archaeon]MDG7022748.1 glutamate--tRNA ligase [Nitrososphaerota archaeon]